MKRFLLTHDAEVKIPAFLACSATLLVFWFIPPPSGLDIRAWHLFAIFLSIILGLIIKPLPMGSLAIAGIAVCTMTGTLTVNQALTSFSSNTVWLILIAFLLARGFIKTGLGSRIAYCFVYFLGKSTLGLAYGLQLTEMCLAPFIPSNTARGAGVIYPIVSSLSKEYESTPEKGTARKIGSFLMLVCFQCNCITSSMFLTGMAANPLIASFAEKHHVNLSWTLWAKAAMLPGFLSLLLGPLVIYFLYPPETKKTPGAKEFAHGKLKDMGPLQKSEWIMIGVFLLLLTLWILGDYFSVHATVAAFIGLSLLLISGVLNWDDILSEKNGWNTFIWLATLLTMSTYLAEFGMMAWFSDLVHNHIHGMSWHAALVSLSLVYFYSHYFFASLTAHVTTMYGAFVGVAILLGCPPVLAALNFAFLSNLCAGLTHYGTGTAPVYYGADYVGIQAWWGLGAVLSVLNLVVWLGIGPIWWRLIGIYS